MREQWLATFGVPKVERRWGFIDRRGVEVIAPQFTSALKFSEGLAAVRPDGRTIGFIDGTGRFRIEAIYAECNGGFCNGIVPVKLGRKWGAIDRDGQVIIEPRYQWLSPFSEGLAAIEATGGRHGFVDAAGEVTIEPRRDLSQVDSFHEGLAAFSAGSKWGFIDTSGQVVIKARFDSVKNFRGGWAAVIFKGHVGFIDREGAFIIEPRFGYAEPLVEGLALAAERERGVVASLSEHMYRGKKWGFIDARGEWVIEPRYARARAFSDGLAAVKLNEQFGFVDCKGTMKIAPQFKSAEGFSGGLAGIAVDELYGFIGLDGEVVIEQKYWRVGTFASVDQLAPMKVTKMKPSKKRPAEPEPVGCVASINASLMTVIADTRHASRWSGIDGPDANRAIDALSKRSVATIVVGSGVGLLISLEVGHGTADLFQPKPGRVVMVEGFVSDADPGYTPWAVTSPARGAREVGKVTVTSRSLSFVESCSAGSSTERSECVRLKVPNGTYRVLLEKETKAAWGSARRCHLVKTT